MKEEYYVAGDRDLMSAVVKTKGGSADNVYPVTKPDSNEDFEFATADLERDEIRWVVKRIQNGKRPMKFRLFRSWKGLIFRKL